VMFINRLLPGGLGGLGANFAYLRQHRHSALQATTVLTANNMMVVIGHALIVAASLAAFPPYQTDIRWEGLAMLTKILLVILAVLLAGLLVWGRQRLVKISTSLLTQLVSYRRRPQHLALALGSSMLLTMGNVLALVACCLALGVHLPFVVILLIFTFGLGTATAVPTPGGLGGFEAGLTAGLIANSIDNSTALSVALLYRMVSYWLPLLPGGIALIFCQRQGVFGR